MLLLIGAVCGFMAGQNLVAGNFNLVIIYSAVSILSFYFAFKDKQ
jgi:hypothetical protein